MSVSSPCVSSAGLLSVLDLSGQAIIYELATTVYMVSILWRYLPHALHAGPAPLTAWGVTEEGQAVPLKAISLSDDLLVPIRSGSCQTHTGGPQLLHRE